jgi:hypothetical protein
LVHEAPFGGAVCSPDAIERGTMRQSVLALVDLLEHRSLTTDEVLTWASAIASQLSSLHELGQWHGGVAAESVWIEGTNARLGPAAGQACPNQPQDIVQFAALLRKMLESVPVTEAARAQWNALDRIASTNSRAGSDSSVKKVASALKLLCSARRIRVLAGSESSAGERVPAPESGRDNRRFLMLVREVPPAAPDNPSRFVAKTVHVCAFLVSAASVAAFGCIMLLRFAKW